MVLMSFPGFVGAAVRLICRIERGYNNPDGKPFATSYAHAHAHAHAFVHPHPHPHPHPYPYPYPYPLY